MDIRRFVIWRRWQPTWQGPWNVGDPPTGVRDAEKLTVVPVSGVEAALSNADSAAPPSEGFWDKPRDGESGLESAYRQGVREAVKVARLDLEIEV